MRILFVATVITVLILAACKQKHEESSYEIQNYTSVTDSVPDSIKVIENGQDTGR